MGSEIESVNILCRESHTVGAKFYEYLDCDQNCVISKTCVTPSWDLGGQRVIV